MYDLVIIGGGIVGMATALRLKEKKPDLKVAVLEKEKSLAQHQTGHNSGVIHSGIYYKPGSLKAENCIRGYHQLLTFCDRENIPYDLCGKIIVASSQKELPALEQIQERGIANGLTGLKRLYSQTEIAAYEPHVRGVAGIFVPQTGIINYTQVTQKYAQVFEKLGGEIFTETQVTGIRHTGNTLVIETSKGDFQAKTGINCAGLFSDEMAALDKEKTDVRIIPFRGEYFEIRPEKQYLVKNLVYPVPDPNFPFLGVHFTRMIGGGVEAGPNAVFAFKKEGYQKTDFSFRDTRRALAWPGFQKVMLKYWKTGLGEYYRSFSKAAFTKALQKLIPEIEETDLLPGGAGVRAQACDRTGGLLDDFMILEDPHFIHVCNAPSPAATSSLAIGETVADLALRQ